MYRKLIGHSWDGLAQQNRRVGGAKGPLQQFCASSLSIWHPRENWKFPKTKFFEELSFDNIGSTCACVLSPFSQTKFKERFFCCITDLVQRPQTKLSKASTCRALNYFMRKLYAGGLFIEGDLCGYIIDASTHFLRGYSWLAATCHNMGLARFPAMPKSHMLFHVRQFLMEQYNSFGYFENPIAASCSCDEDMIGRVCYLTRCVSPKTRIKRCYERYLTQVLLLMRRCN